jgi:DNA topoisomerase-1
MRASIGERFGEQYLPATPNIYKTKKEAQDAHEAIRPTSVAHTRTRLSKYLSEDE